MGLVDLCQAAADLLSRFINSVSLHMLLLLLLLLLLPSPSLHVFVIVHAGTTITNIWDKCDSTIRRRQILPNVSTGSDVLVRNQ